MWGTYAFHNIKKTRICVESKLKSTEVVSDESEVSKPTIDSSIVFHIVNVHLIIIQKTVKQFCYINLPI